MRLVNREARRGRIPQRTPVAIRALARLIQADGPARKRNLERLRALASERDEPVTVCCAHDEMELERARARHR